MPLDSDFKTPLITSERFWPCLVSISLFKAHLGSKTNRFSLSPHWSFSVTADTQRRYWQSWLKKKISQRMNQKNGLMKKSGKLCLRQARAYISVTKSDDADMMNAFHVCHHSAAGWRRRTKGNISHKLLGPWRKKNPTTTTTPRFVKVSHVSYWVECKPLWLILFYRKLPPKHSILNTCVQTVSATEYINHPGGRLKAAQISRGNKQYVAPMLMGFSPLTCAAILIIN